MATGNVNGTIMVVRTPPAITVCCVAFWKRLQGQESERRGGDMESMSWRRDG